MRLYAIAVITWAVIITASSEPNISNSSDQKTIDHPESRDSPATRQIVQPYVTGIEARSSGQTGTEDHSNEDIANAVLSGSAAVRSSERESNDATTTDSTSAAVYVTPFTGTASDAYSFGGHLNLGESGYTIPEDVLVVENAGSFGQRVRQGQGDKKAAKTTDDRQNDDYASYRKSFSSTVSLLDDIEHGRIFASTTKPHGITRISPVLKKERVSADDSPPSESKTIRFEIFPKNFDVVSGTASTTDVQPLGKKNVASNENEFENLPQPQTRSSQEYNRSTADESTKKLPEELPVEKSESVTRISTSVEISPSLQLGRFSGPIVVPDLPDEEIQDVVIDYLDDGNSDASGIKSFRKNDEQKTNLEIDTRGSKTAASNGITMSSIMLKPLQVGITLVNADEAALAVDNEQSAATDTDYLQDDLQRLAIADEGLAEYKENQSRVSYKESLQRVEEAKPVEAVTQKVHDNSVEIQKSIELFHTAPVHEIHYPVEYIQQTSNLGVIETNNIGNAQNAQWKQTHGQGDQERSELQSNYDVYQGNDQVDKNVIKAHASTLSQRYNRYEYDVPENKPTTPPLIAEYLNSREQSAEEVESQSFKYDVQSVLLIPSQSGGALHDQSDSRHSLNGNSDMPARGNPRGSSARPQVASKYANTYVAGTYRTQQPQPIADQQHPFRSPETRRPEAQQQLLLKIVPDGSAGNGGFLVPLPRPYPIEKIVEKTVHVPHPVEVEKVIEKTVPFPVERVVEKQVPVQVQVPVPMPVPQPYPVRVVPVQHVYPIHMERRVPPLLVQRPVPQSPVYPLHVRLPVAYPVTHAPAERTAAEKAASQGAASRPSRPYRADVERQPSIGVTFDKYRQKSNGESIHENVVPRGPSPGKPTARPSEINASQFYHGDPGGYAAGQPLAAYNYVSAPQYSDFRLMILPRVYSSHAVTSRPRVVSSLYAVPLSVRRQTAYNLVEQDEATKGNEYVGPAPLSHKYVPRSKTRSSQHPASVTAQPQSATTTTVLRKSRQPETRYPGSFRQSKMEYGFKPPMVPSVQYDENTAAKVEN